MAIKVLDGLLAQRRRQGLLMTSGVLHHEGPSFPASLALAWTSEKWAKSLKGANPSYSDTPTVTADGVAPGDGPSFTDIVAWTDGGTLVVRFTADTASADIVGDVQVFGPVYAYSGGLKAKDGTNTATVSASWGVGDVVTVVCQCDGDVMRVGVV